MIRPATKADLDQVLRIERAAFTAPHWPWEAYEQMLADDGPMRRTLLVEVEVEVELEMEADQVQGFAGGTLLYQNAQLESIAVAENARRRGLGRALCMAFLDWAQHLGADTVGLEVRAGSVNVQRLYGALGFRPIGVRPRYYTNPVEDGVLMECRLEQKTNLRTPDPHV